MLTKINLQTLTIGLIFIMLITVFTINYTTHTYLLFIILLLVGFVHIIKKMKLTKTNVDFIPILFIFIWLYGFLLGILNNNNINYVIANYFGMVVYIVYFIIISFNIKKDTIVKILIFSSIINITGSIFFSIYQFLNIENLLNSIMTTGQVRFFYFLNMSTFYITMIYTFSIIFIPNKFKNNELSSMNLYFRYETTILLFILSIIALLLSASKGYILGFLVLIVVSFILLFKSYFLTSKSNKKVIYVYLCILLLIFFLIIFDYDKLFTMIFSDDDTGNIVRYKQIDLLFNDLTFFGKGLGAEIANNDDGNTYGFELSYLNILHKFGIMAIFILFGYIATIYLIFKNFTKNIIRSLIALSCMGYLLPSVGNPIIFAPINVILHVLALLIINNKEK